ncbi:DsbA family protein [Xanthobacter sp. KR7-225]|uniref:DsbA family protein n=1 Tax=Xanthobacter sp. KR7-225 TaxID=3156613 RepID=UPI0032B5320D
MAGHMRRAGPTRRLLLRAAAGALGATCLPCAARSAATGAPLTGEAAAKLGALPGKAVLGAARTAPRITELVDFNAADWRRSALDMRELLASDAQLAYGLVQAPLFDVRSLEAARVALAVLAKGIERFETFYLALAESEGPVDGVAALAAAQRAGLDRFQVFNASIQPEYTEALAKAAALASALGVLDTPAYVIGGEVFTGYLDLARKRALLAVARP